MLLKNELIDKTTGVAEIVAEPIELLPLPHPGATVVEYLEFHKWSQDELARRTDLAPEIIGAICDGKAPITPAAALAFEAVFQRPARLWLTLQRQYDEQTAPDQGVP